MSDLRESPKTRQEFVDRYLRNNTVEREGMSDQLTHLPCMFCGCPDMMLLHALNVKEDLMRGGKCQECGRGIQVIFDNDGDLIKYEVLQTEGADPPEYIEPWPRRVT